MYETTTSSGFGVAMWLFYLAVYLYWALAQFKIAQKTGHHDTAWWAFIPILNVYQWTRLAGRPWYWFVLCLVPFVNVVFMAWLWVDIAKNCGQSPLWGILIMIPLVNLVAVGILGFSPAPKPSMFADDKPAPRQPTHAT